MFNGCGEITALLDKEADRELIPAGQCANELQLFEDRPDEYDAGIWKNTIAATALRWTARPA